jgi:acid phosphatase (class A)
MKIPLSPRVLCLWLLVAAGIPGLAVAANAPGPSSPAGPDTPAATHGPKYLLGSQANMLNLLPPPPATDSEAQRDDLKAVLEAQRVAHANGTIQHAIADVDLNCASMGDALGNPGVLLRDPEALNFLNEAAREAASLTGTPKNHWKRARPFAFSSQVEALGDMASAAKALTPAQAALRNVDTGSGPGAMTATSADLAHSSYPSGHSAFATVCAILLADMVPEKGAALYARGLDFAHSRMVVGAHFPTDLEGGRLTGTVAAELLLQNASFQHDFAVARGSLRAAMGLAVEPAD